MYIISILELSEKTGHKWRSWTLLGSFDHHCVLFWRALPSQILGSFQKAYLESLCVGRAKLEVIKIVHSPSSTKRTLSPDPPPPPTFYIRYCLRYLFNCIDLRQVTAIFCMLEIAAKKNKKSNWTICRNYGKTIIKKINIQAELLFRLCWFKTTCKLLGYFSGASIVALASSNEHESVRLTFSGFRAARHFGGKSRSGSGQNIQQPEEAMPVWLSSHPRNRHWVALLDPELKSGSILIGKRPNFW